jgi:hypothetical protein
VFLYLFTEYMKLRPEFKMYAVVECFTFLNILATMHCNIGKESNSVRYSCLQSYDKTLKYVNLMTIIEDRNRANSQTFVNIRYCITLNIRYT